MRYSRRLLNVTDVWDIKRVLLLWTIPQRQKKRKCFPLTEAMFTLVLCYTALP